MLTSHLLARINFKEKNRFILYLFVFDKKKKNTNNLTNIFFYILEQVTIRNYDLPDGGYNITYSSISTSALSTCHFYLITGILNDKNFGYLLHSSKDFQSSSDTPKTTAISIIKYIVHAGMPRTSQHWGAVANFWWVEIKC
jgi:hypothetical protein